ncbi:MAG: hypothetical protein J6W63_09095 [Treponema sp.]|nr:hypothetical protein [Treponema sp.]
MKRMILTEEQFGTVSDRIDEIIKLSISGILGNSRASLVDIKNAAKEAKDALFEAIIGNDGGDAA